jgi:hypothetical protein
MFFKILRLKKRKTRNILTDRLRLLIQLRRSVSSVIVSLMRKRRLPISSWKTTIATRRRCLFGSRLCTAGKSPTTSASGGREVAANSQSVNVVLNG